MNVDLLFRKRSTLETDGLPWLSGCEEHTHTARRNKSGRGAVSAILVRALLAALDGSVSSGAGDSGGTTLLLQVASKSRPGAESRCLAEGFEMFVPHGGPEKVTYHVGLLAMGRAMRTPGAARDFWEAYLELLTAYHWLGKDEKIRPTLLKAADELYYWLRYQDGDPEKSGSDILNSYVIRDNANIKIEGEWTLPLPVHVLTNSAALATMLGPKVSPPAAKTEVAPASEPVVDGFDGWQANAIRKAVEAGEHILCGGPTGTGKTMAINQVALATERALVVVEGKEGLLDLDFFGALLPQADGSRRWVDGPLLRAMRIAEIEPVMLFIDEINRIPRHQINLLIGLMNRKSAAICRQMGLGITGNGDWLTVEVPTTSEVVVCPAENLQIIGAANFGGAYATYALDPALRRRFDTLVEFEYLEPKLEIALVLRQTPGLPAKVADALVKLAGETRRMYSNGDLPGCIDVGSLLSWARKCARLTDWSVETVMTAAERTWADQVCGRNHAGQINKGNLDGLTDHLKTLKILPSVAMESRETVEIPF